MKLLKTKQYVPEPQRKELRFY